MPFRDKEKQKLYNKQYGAEWYRRNRGKTLARSKENTRRKRKEWNDYKSTLCCHICGESHPAIIDFHHTEKPEGEKVSYYVRQNQWKRAYEEAKKCQPLCANCHRKLHYNERVENVDEGTD